MYCTRHWAKRSQQVARGWDFGVCVMEALIGSRDVKSDEHGEHVLLLLCYALVFSNAKCVHQDLCLRRLQLKYSLDILTSKNTTVLRFWLRPNKICSLPRNASLGRSFYISSFCHKLKLFLNITFSVWISSSQKMGSC